MSGRGMFGLQRRCQQALEADMALSQTVLNYGVRAKAYGGNGMQFIALFFIFILFLLSFYFISNGYYQNRVPVVPISI